MSALASKTVIGEAKCHCCGKRVEVKANKNGNAYYFCPWSDETGQPCSHHERWGKSKSRKFVEVYLAGKQMAVVAPQTAPEAANLDRPPRPKLVAAPKPAPEPAKTPEKSPTGTYEDYLS